MRTTQKQAQECDQVGQAQSTNKCPGELAHYRNRPKLRPKEGQTLTNMVPCRALSGNFRPFGGCFGPFRALSGLSGLVRSGHFRFRCLFMPFFGTSRASGLLKSFESFLFRALLVGPSGAFSGLFGPTHRLRACCCLLAARRREVRSLASLACSPAARHGDNDLICLLVARVLCALDSDCH